MKKIISLFFVLVLASALVSAAGQNNSGGGEQAKQGDTVMVQKAEPTLYQQGEGNQTREKLETGLQNALTRVTNENARQRLQQNIEKFMQKYQERMQRMEGVEVEDVDNETGAVTVRAREEVRFLGFIKGKATKRFEIDGKGNINERAPWYRFLYREVQQE
ncbi:hypothetical protein KY331_01825 [Candidatus Woesearchaeota archaeon]|nr:hypothetical protein [Candidatus Woesearchaeota archaeon]